MMKNLRVVESIGLNKGQEDLVCLAVERLLKQGLPSKEGVSCRYLSCDGKKCIVGQLISSEYYSEDIEGKTIYNPKTMKAMHDSWPDVDLNTSLIKLLAFLQNAHDTSSQEVVQQKFTESFLEGTKPFFTPEYVKTLEAKIAKLNKENASD